MLMTASVDWDPVRQNHLRVDPKRAVCELLAFPPFRFAPGVPKVNGPGLALQGSGN
jgi:hypothetical protein